MGEARRIRERSRRWFPHYVPAFEVYCGLARAALGSGRDVLHLGAGKDSYGVIERLRRYDLRVVSLDLDSHGLARNPNPVRVTGDAGLLPFRSSVFDLIVSEDVFEHLRQPSRVLRECHRCLKPQGALVFLCPNGFSYIALAGRLTPHKVHRFFKRTFMGAADSDVFPTYYRLNSPGRIRKIAAETGFRTEAIQSFVGWPTYWEFSDLLHRCFILMHRILEVLPSWAHITLAGVLRRED